MAAATDSRGSIRVVSDAEILEAYRLLASREGMFCEPASAASVAGLLKDPKPARDLRVFLGRAQWTPNQLHAEILEGSWYVVPVQAKFVFSADPANMWRTLVGHAELQEVNASPGGADDPFALLRFARAWW